MATLIGLSITTKLIRSLSLRFKISVRITPGTHNQEDEVNEQLADKERVTAALENAHLLRVVNGKDTDVPSPPSSNMQTISQFTRGGWNITKLKF